MNLDSVLDLHIIKYDGVDDNHITAYLTILSYRRVLDLAAGADLRFAAYEAVGAHTGGVVHIGLGGHVFIEVLAVVVKLAFL